MQINDTLNKYKSSGTLILIPKIEDYIKYTLIRILDEEKSISHKNFETCIGKLSEIGKIIGGLIKANRLTP